MPEADAPKKNDGAVQLDLFTDYAGTEVGSDLIILQKDTLSQREYTSLERSFVEVGTQADGTTQNEYFDACIK